MVWLAEAPCSTHRLHPHLQDNSWLNLARELIFTGAELLQSSDLSGRQALNSRSFAGVSGSTHELLYKDVPAEMPAQPAPRGATEHGSAERGAPGWALLWDNEHKPAGLPRRVANAFCNRAITSHWKGLFWEQGNDLELAGYLRKLSLLRWLLAESRPEQRR